MKQIFIVLAFFLFLPFSTHAQDEYDYREMMSEIWPNDDNKEYYVTSGAPIVTSMPFSKSEAIYSYSDVKMLKGDMITKIGHMGYNPGAEVERHVIIWMQNIDMMLHRVGSGFESVDNMTKVFEGDIVIKSGGQSDNWIQLTDITLDEPFTYDEYSGVRITILSYGDVSDHDVCFARSDDKNSALCSTSDQMEDISDNPQADMKPQIKYTVASKVDYLTGQVSDQDGNPVAGAEVTLSSSMWEVREYKSLTDEEGHYQVRLPENNVYFPSVKAPGFVPYMEVALRYGFDQDEFFWSIPFEDKKMDFTLFNALDFKAGVAGTIILPVEPDPTLGKYYRLDRREDLVLVFERERFPQANVPYLLVADEDCRIDISGMDLSITPGKTVIDEYISFIGSYENTNHIITTNQEVHLIDHTPDCGGDAWHVGGCRAYVLVDMLYGPFYYMLNEDDGVGQFLFAPNDKDADCYDLQGRKLPSGTIPRGIYISNGKKQLGR